MEGLKLLGDCKHDIRNSRKCKKCKERMENNSRIIVKYFFKKGTCLYSDCPWAPKKPESKEAQ